MHVRSLLFIGLFGLLAPGAQAAHVRTPTPTTAGVQDMDIGSDADVFVISRGSASNPNGRIYQWAHKSWVAYPGEGTRIAVDGHGRPWHINSRGEIYRYAEGRWLRVPGAARSIDIGRDGNGQDQVFIIRTNLLLARFDGSGFVDYGGGWGFEVTVDDQGSPWVIRGDVVHQFIGGRSWRGHYGLRAIDIDAANDGSVYAVEKSPQRGLLRRYDRSTGSWMSAYRYGERVAVSPTGATNVVEANGTLSTNFYRQIHGDASCVAGSSDCNPCAFDVRGQFRAMLGYGHKNNLTTNWRFNPSQTYSPSGLTAADAFDNSYFIIPSDHLQGFVRTQQPSRPFAGTFSDDHYGSLFTVRPWPGDTYALANLHQTGGDEHPSGAHALGDWVGTNESGRLKVVNLLTNQAVLYDLSLPPGEAGNSSGGGLGLARLGPNKYLVASTLPGGGDDGVRATYFWELSQPLGVPPRSMVRRYVGGRPHQMPFSEPRTNENLTLITECESGEIYGIHSSGEAQPYGNGHWRVSRLEQAEHGPVMRALDYYYEGQNMQTCYHRAAATAFVESDRSITTYCSAYDDSSAWPADRLSFTERTANYAQSCLLSCGGRAPGGCWCDSLCVGYGDCCNDEAVQCQR